MTPINSISASVLLTFVLQVSSADTQLSLPNAKIYQVLSENRLKPWTRINENFETVVENVENLRLDCTASYPVQWIYTGNGIPVYTSTNKYSRSNNHGETVTEYTSTVFITPLKETHTGNYQCSPAEFIDGRTFFQIYVPGQNLFVSTTGHNIIIPKNDTTILIPCTVSHPDAYVTLDKVEGTALRKVKVKSSDAVVYDPKQGFKVKLDKVENPEGTYVCTARHGQVTRMVEYKVRPYFSEFPSDQPFQNLEKCKKDCGENAFCSIEGGKEVCKCYPEFNGDPNSKCVIKCNSHTDCPSTMSCFVDRQCRNPCIHSMVGCGLSAKCRTENHRPICYCPPDYIGDETVQCFNTLQGSQPESEFETETVSVRPQSPSRPRPTPGPPLPTPSKPTKPSTTGRIKCSSNTDCPPSMTCIRTSASNSDKECIDPCATRKCGMNADCKVESRRAFCECKNGFIGDARVECEPIKFEKGPTFEPLKEDLSVQDFSHKCTNLTICGPNSRCRMDKNGKHRCMCNEGYYGQPPKCRPECKINQDCTSNRTCLLDSRVGYPFCAKMCASRICGVYADCGELENGSFECYCPEGLYGDPYVKCETKEQRIGKDCSVDYDCGTKLRCDIQEDERKCVDPCAKHPCGRDLVCDAQDHKAKCVCPRGSTGNEYVGCLKDVEIDESTASLCANLKCGQNSECRIVNGVGKCFCQSGFIGKSPVCVAECHSNTDCPSDLTCVQKRCRHRCEGCGQNSRCRVAPNSDRTSVCSCIEGFEGNPYIGCYPPKK